MSTPELAQYSLKDGKIHRGGRVIDPNDLVEALNEKGRLENECDKLRLSNGCLYEALEQSSYVTSDALEVYRCELRQEEEVTKDRNVWQRMLIGLERMLVWLEFHTLHVTIGILLLIVLYGAVLRLLASYTSFSFN